WGRCLADLAQIEKSSWLAKKNGDYRFVGPQLEKMWSAFLGCEAGRRHAHAQVLYMKDEPVSFTFAVTTDDEVYVLANQYDEKVKTFSTGSILYRSLFRDAIAAGVKVVNLGGGNAGYKARWGAAAEIPLRDYTFFRPSLRGKALYAAFGARSMAQAIRRAKPRRGAKPEGE